MFPKSIMSDPFVAKRAVYGVKSLNVVQIVPVFVGSALECLQTLIGIGKYR